MKVHGPGRQGMRGRPRDAVVCGAIAIGLIVLVVRGSLSGLLTMGAIIGVAVFVVIAMRGLQPEPSSDRTDDQDPRRLARDSLISGAIAIGLIGLTVTGFLPPFAVLGALFGVTVFASMAIRDGRRARLAVHGAARGMAIAGRILGTVVITLILALMAYLAWIAWAIRDFGN